MQPLQSGIISIHGSLKTWTWKQFSILASQITEKSEKGAQSDSQGTSQIILKPEQQENGQRGLRWRDERYNGDYAECVKAKVNQYKKTVYYTDDLPLKSRKQRIEKS